ncbi:MAG: hypothetical protein WCG26_13350 [Chloroflexales bacterium]
MFLPILRVSMINGVLLGTLWFLWDEYPWMRPILVSSVICGVAGGMLSERD